METKFGERLKELRLERNLSQEKLGSNFSVDHRTISNWENSIREPDFSMLMDIAKFFGVSADYLLGLED